MMELKLKYCTIHRFKSATVVTLKSGQTSTNWPLGDPAFGQTASSCGFEDLTLYVFEHEVAHAFLAEKMFDMASPTQERAAQGLPASPASLFEERLVWHWQRFVAKRASLFEPEWIEWRQEWDALLREDSSPAEKFC